jgi:hypothetical protein
MSLYTLLYLRTISKAKKFPLPLRTYSNLPCPSPMVSRQREATHAL